MKLLVHPIQPLMIHETKSLLSTLLRKSVKATEAEMKI